ADRFGKVLRVVVDYLIGAEAAHIIDIGGAGSRDHARAQMLGELDREACNPAGTALNEDGLAALKLERRLDGDDGGKAGESYRGRLDMWKRGELLGDDRRGDRELLRIGALAAGFEHAEHGVSDFQIMNIGRNRRNSAGKIAAQNQGEFCV